MGALKVAVMSAATDTLVFVGLLAVTVGALRPVLSPTFPPPPPHPARLNTVEMYKVKPLKKSLRNILNIPRLISAVK
jgi:hypothetical protein